MNQREWIEHINWVDDPRNNVLDTGLEPDENEMIVRWMRCIDDDERDDPTIQALGDVDEVEVKFPAKFIVCDLCEGKGSHVNPNIDAGGISSDDDFWENDYDDEVEYELDEDATPAEIRAQKKATSRYMRGDYNVPCNCCGGKRVVLTIDRNRANAKMLAKYDEFLKDRAETAAIIKAERRRGC